MTRKTLELAVGPTSEPSLAQNGSVSPKVDDRSSTSDLILTELFPVNAAVGGLAVELDSSNEAPLSELDELEVSTETVETTSSPPVARTWDDDDQALKEAFLGGSEEAFIRLYAKYEVSLLYYCKRMLRDDFLAEDAFQELWTRVFELRKKPGVVILHFRGLLFRSARNLCMNVLRVQRPTVSTSDERNELTESEPMSGEASTREMQDLMLKALAKLPFDQRETFILHEYSGFSYAEIARMMETTERNVKVRAYRARMRLRKFIQGWLGLGETDDPVSYI